MFDLSQEDWKAKLAEDENSFVLDVRAPEELEEGQIPEAINIDFYKGEDFLAELKKLDPSKNYYIYCRSGNRSGQTCALMKSLGFANTYNLAGGFMNWTGEVAE